MLPDRAFGTGNDGTHGPYKPLRSYRLPQSGWTEEGARGTIASARLHRVAWEQILSP